MAPSPFNYTARYIHTHVLQYPMKLRDVRGASAIHIAAAMCVRMAGPTKFAYQRLLAILSSMQQLKSNSKVQMCRPKCGC